MNKRFWKTVSIQDHAGGFGILLDDRSVRTPAKALLIVPTLALAERIMTEWDTQQDRIDPNQMPMTRSANSAIDKVRPQKKEVADMLTAYGDSDLLCYRATSPAGLVSRQAEGWDPVLDWAAEALQVRLEPRSGVMHQNQDRSAISKLGGLVDQFGSFELAGFHDLVALSGSLIVGFAAVQGAMSIQDLWDLSRIDENWQISQWGEDEEEARQVEIKRQAFLHAADFVGLVNDAILCDPL